MMSEGFDEVYHLEGGILRSKAWWEFMAKWMLYVWPEGRH
jgi:predicted sulfurtransferase